jgi:hypothetical protein
VRACSSAQAATHAPRFGLFNLIYGAWMLVHGIELRQAGKTIRSAFTPEKKERRKVA